MHKVTGIMIAIIGLALPAKIRPHETGLTLRVESMTGRPVTFTVWTRVRSHVDSLRDSLRAVDSLTKTAPASIPIDSATREIRVLTKANAAVRVRVLEDSRELQRPANAWGRDLRLVRVDDVFQVLFDARLLQPR